MIDDKTPLGIPLPHPENDPYSQDVARMRAAFTMIDEFLTDLTTASSDAVKAIVNDAPETLNTLREIAAALENNPSIISDLRNAIGAKASSSDVASALRDINSYISETVGELDPRIDALEANTSSRARQIARGIAYSRIR